MEYRNITLIAWRHSGARVWYATWVWRNNSSSSGLSIVLRRQPVLHPCRGHYTAFPNKAQIEIGREAKRKPSMPGEFPTNSPARIRRLLFPSLPSSLAPPCDATLRISRPRQKHLSMKRFALIAHITIAFNGSLMLYTDVTIFEQPSATATLPTTNAVERDVSAEQRHAVWFWNYQLGYKLRIYATVWRSGQGVVLETTQKLETQV